MPDHPPPEAWMHNLEALLAVNPALAERLAALPIPPNVEPAVGRDDHPNWRIRRDSGQVEWFGRTSMPTVSAEGLLAQFQPGLGNVVLAGIGSGLEAKLLSERLGRHRATVVLETDPLNLALALRLWDMAAGLRNRQVVLLLADDMAGLGEQLADLCAQHPGFEPPGKMLAWPWRTRQENHEWQGLLEQVSTHVCQVRGSMLAQHVESLRKAAGGGQVEAAAILSTTPGLLTGYVVETLAEGAAAANLGAASCWPRDPLHAGSMAGLGAAAELASRHRRVQLILVDQPRPAWLADADLRLLIWLVARRIDESFQPMPGRDDWVISTSGRQRQQLAERGWPENRILRAAPFVSPMAFESVEKTDGEGVVLLHDLLPEDPEQAGVTLYSQKVLWQALRERLAAQPDAWKPADAQAWFGAAQVSTGIDLADPVVQEQFLAAIRNGLAPSVVLSRAAKAVLEAGLPLRICGRGWERLDWAKPVHAGPADDPHERLRALRSARVAIVGEIRPGQAWLALEAAAAGAAIMARPLWDESDPTQLLAAGSQMVTWAGRQELIERLRHLLKNEPARAQMVEQARQRARQEHAADVRLRQVLEQVSR